MGSLRIYEAFAVTLEAPNTTFARNLFEEFVKPVRVISGGVAPVNRGSQEHLFRGLRYIREAGQGRGPATCQIYLLACNLSQKEELNQAAFQELADSQPDPKFALVLLCNCSGCRKLKRS